MLCRNMALRMLPAYSTMHVRAAHLSRRGCGFHAERALPQAAFMELDSKEPLAFYHPGAHKGPLISLP